MCKERLALNYCPIILKITLHIALLIGLSTITSFCQVLNDQCNGPNIGSGSLYAEKMIGCVPFTLRIIKTDTQSTGHKFIYDYKGGVPANLVEVKSHTYTTPGAYKVLQSSFRKDNGQELRVCGIVTVLDTNKLILKPKICGNKVSLEVVDGKKAGLLLYDYCLIDWGDASSIEKINLPSSSISHTYANQTDKKITVTGRYEVDFCPSNSSITITFPKAPQPQITVLEKTGNDKFSISFNNYSGENVKILASNVAITSKNGEVGLQKISFINATKNTCYAIQLESACFSNNVSKELCDIDFEVNLTETSNELKWKQPQPEVIKDFTLFKMNLVKQIGNWDYKLLSTIIRYIESNKFHPHQKHRYLQKFLFPFCAYLFFSLSLFLCVAHYFVEGFCRCLWPHSFLIPCGFSL